MASDLKDKLLEKGESSCGKDVDSTLPEDDPELISKETMRESMKSLWVLAANGWLTNVLQILPDTITLYILSFEDGEEEILEGIATGKMFINLTTFSIAVGMGISLESMASQAYGAGNYRHVGLYLQKALVIVSIPLILCFCVYPFTKDLLLAIGTSETAASYSYRYLALAKYGVTLNVLTMCLRFYLNAQKIYKPQSISAIISFSIFPVFPWLFIRTLGWGIEGAGMCYLAGAIVRITALVSIALWTEGYDRRTWQGWSWDLFEGIGSYIIISLKSLALRSIEWWTFEVMVLQLAVMANYEDRPDLLAIHTVVQNFITFNYMVAIGLAGASTAYVGNNIGEGQPTLARRYTNLTLTSGAVVMLLQCLFFTFLAIPLARIFTSEGELREQLQAVLPYMAIVGFAHGLQGIFSGILFGLGMMGIPAIYSGVFSLGLGETLAFVFWYFGHWQLKGIYIGIAIGFALTALAYFLCEYYADYHSISLKIRLREKDDDEGEVPKKKE